MTAPGPSSIRTTWRDAFGRRRRVRAPVRRQVLAAMGGGEDSASAGQALVCLAARGGPLERSGELTLEDGTRLGRVDRLPPDVPWGYHRLRRDDDADVLLIVSPGRCHLPPGLRAWGWAAQLYAARSRASWGTGDLADLRTLASWSAGLGAEFVAVSPLWAPNPGPNPEASPYFPSTRRFLNPLLLRIEEVDGAETLGARLGELAAAGRRLNRSRTINRARIQALKLEALEALWRARDWRRHRRFARYRSESGAALRGWGIFVTLSERLGPGWRSWPEAFRRRKGAAVARFAADHADRVVFHAWVQWLLDEQLRAAAGPCRIVNDLPIGVDPGGFDGWDWQGQLAEDASIGAPPDQFNPAGQAWAMPPFAPHRLRQVGYEPVVRTVRAAMRHAGGMRIDHVLGLFRQWWVPRGNPPADGAYVTYPAEELLAILAVESHRAGAIVIGEDLGTVPRGVRPRLARANVLSTRLLYFEGTPPRDYPRKALAAVGTHDLPTIAGVWTGSDLVDQRLAGLVPDARGLAQFRRRLAQATGLGSFAVPRAVILAAHAAVAVAPSVLATASLEDALAVEKRPNIPGTIPPQRENWARPLPLPLEELVRDPFVLRLADAMRR